MKQKLFSFLLLTSFFVVKFQSFSQGWVGKTTVNPNVLYALNGSNALTPLNVGIGVSSPTAQFHTTGTVRFAGLGNDNTLTRVLVQDASGNLSYRDVSTIGSTLDWRLSGNAIGATDFIGTTNAADFRIRTNNIQRMLINSSGNVSINSIVNNNFAKLNVYNNTEDAHFRASGSSPSLTFSQNEGIPTATDVTPYARLGLATRSGAFATNAAVGDLVIQNVNNNSIIFSTNYRNEYNNGTFRDERMRISANGNVGIGTSAPTAILHTSGNVRFENLPVAPSPLNILVVDANGNVYRTGTATAARPSSSSIQSAEVKSLQEQLLQLKNELERLKNKISLLNGSGSTTNLKNTDLPYLESNIPNPFRTATVVNYSIPTTFSNGLSYINVFDESGKLIKKYKITNTVKGSLSVNDLSNLSSEILVCSLEVNGKVYDYKKMVITR